MNFVEELVQAFGVSTVITNPNDMIFATEDWRGRYHGKALCVVRPTSTQQVSEIVTLCSQKGITIIPQGGNTGLVGGSVPSSSENAPVIVCLDRMRQIIKVDDVNNTMEVQAGCILANIHEAAKAHDRFYPVSLGAEGSCQIGGTIATNAGGTSVLRYGNTRENVLGLEVVLPDGSIWSGLKALRKNNTGYDLKHLFIGSEGTLGIVTAAVLKLHPLPVRSAVSWAGLDNPEQALRLLTSIQATYGAKLSGFELMNRKQLDLVLEYVPQRRSPVVGDYNWHLLIELSDSGGEDDLDSALQTILEQAFGAELIADAMVATSEAQKAAIWEVRHSVSEANKKAGVGLTTDCAVPVSAAPQFIEKATEAVKAIVPSVEIVVVGHMGDGNIHFIPFFSFDEWNTFSDHDNITALIRHTVNDIAAELGGTFSAEHGVGQTQLAEMSRYIQPVELALMKAVKSAIDPQNLFNPDRLLPAS